MIEGSRKVRFSGGYNGEFICGIALVVLSCHWELKEVFRANMRVSSPS